MAQVDSNTGPQSTFLRHLVRHRTLSKTLGTTHNHACKIEVIVERYHSKHESALLILRYSSEVTLHSLETYVHTCSPLEYSTLWTPLLPNDYQGIKHSRVYLLEDTCIYIQAYTANLESIATFTRNMLCFIAERLSARHIIGTLFSLSVYIY